MTATSPAVALSLLLLVAWSFGVEGDSTQAIEGVKDVIEQSLSEVNEKVDDTVGDLQDQLKKQTQRIKGLRDEITGGGQDDFNTFVQINDFVKKTSIASNENVGVLIDAKIAARQPVLITETQSISTSIDALNADIVALTATVRAMVSAVNKDCVYKEATQKPLT